MLERSEAARPPVEGDSAPDARRRAILADFAALSGRATPPPPPDRDDVGVRERTECPWPYMTGDGRQVGSFLAGVGFVLDLCRARRGHRVLEVGSTWAHLSFAMARLGCEVTLQTSDPTDAAALRRRADQDGVAVTVVEEAGAAREPFDFVLSQGSMRGRLDHPDLFAVARDSLLAPGGRLLLVGEPLREDLPEPWMLDPGAAALIREQGVLALAFRPSYLLDLLAELGFNAEMIVCPASPYGNTIIAGRRMQERSQNAAPTR